jgi:cell division transport system permease protein
MAEGWKYMTSAQTPNPERLMRGGKPAPIVPAGSVSGRALTIVIAIMTFLACLTLGSVLLVRETSRGWQSQIAREATIQVKPGDFDIDAALEKARATAASFPGVTGAEIVGREETVRLLEPWLGAGLNIEELPVPRLIVITLNEDSLPDFPALQAQLRQAVPGAALDDHRSWVGRLVSMAQTTTSVGIAILILVLSATVLTVVFATRGAMAGSDHVIEVLHFVGAQGNFIASEYRHHFLSTGLRGSMIGGGAALFLFLGIGWWTASNRATPQADQIAAMFGNFQLGWQGLASIVFIVIAIVLITALTSHLTVTRHLAELDQQG